MHRSPVSISTSWLPFQLYLMSLTGRSTMRRVRPWARTFPARNRLLVMEFRADPAGKQLHRCGRRLGGFEISPAFDHRYKGGEEFLMTVKSTRDHLLDTGLKLMHQHGYHETGLTEILKAADVAKGSFYHHFGSKEDFAAAALERYGMRERAHAAAVLNDMKTPPLKRLRRYFNDLVKMYGQMGAIPGCMMGRFSLEIAGESPQLRNRISA